jgi:4-hydroxybenzoate polyprenyltransferase
MDFNNTAPHLSIPGITRLKLFFALSRTPHGLLDMATPCFAALLWIGEFPSFQVILLGLITVFAGYTAVYALNDLVDYQIDQEKINKGGYCNPDNYLDAMMVRHPMAQGCLSFKQGLIWALSWSAVALIGAYLLNPVCVLIFVIACCLETFYCIMWRISPLRAVVSGAVKTSGPIAGIFAVDPSPSPLFVMVLFLAFFFWEIGGQNIPADWTDLDSDRRLKAQTIPVRFGTKRSAEFLLFCLVFSLMLMTLAFQLPKSGLEPGAAAISLFLGSYLLLFPAIRLYKTKSRQDAMALFNKSSYYPVALLAVVLINFI